MSSFSHPDGTPLYLDIYFVPNTQRPIVSESQILQDLLSLEDRIRLNLDASGYNFTEAFNQYLVTAVSHFISYFHTGLRISMS